jgi:Tfp pilus assembly protein PilP
MVIAVAAVLSVAFSVGDTSAARDSDCMRLVPQEQAVHPDIDGPGSFGPLQGTLTLGCLRVLSIRGAGKDRIATVVDERSHTYEVRAGAWIGENGGRISEITDRRITVVQVVLGADGKFIETNRYLFLHAAHES